MNRVKKNHFSGSAETGPVRRPEVQLTPSLFPAPASGGDSNGGGYDNQPSEPRPQRDAALTELDRYGLPCGFNDTARDYPREACVHRLFEEQAERTPNAIALVHEIHQFTYRELNHRANQLAQHLRGLGVGPEVLVGIFLERYADMVVALLGILKAGGAYVPLDPFHPKERLAHIVQDSRIGALITEQKLLQELPPHTAKTICLDRQWEMIANGGDNMPLVAYPSDTLAYAIYTSGSTGRPKGVQVTHRSLVNFLTSMRRHPGLEKNDVLVAVTTLSFDIAGLEILLPLIVGARTVIASADDTVDGHRLLQLLERSGATVMQGTPATWRLLIEAGWNGKPGIKVLCGGEALPVELGGQLLARSPSVWNLYGLTEATIWSAVGQVQPNASKIYIGRPIANTQFCILDNELKPVPMGNVGELHIGGDGLARGYLNSPGLTAEKFIADPCSADPGARLYKTGDLARFLPEGNIEFLGRSDQDITSAERYWSELLEDFDTPTVLAAKPLPTEFSADGNYKEVQTKLSRTVTDKLRSFAREHGLTPGTIVQGAWALIVSRYTGQDDIVFGTTRAGRQGIFDGAQQRVGLFINTLPVRVRLSPDIRVLAWLREMRNQAVAARPFEDTPLVKIQEWSKVPGNRPLFDSLFVFDNQLFNSAATRSLDIAENRHFLSLATTNYPLTVTGFLEPELVLGIEYDRNLFDNATIVRMVGHLQTLVENLIVDPNQTLACVPMLTKAERQQILVDWNDTAREYPASNCVHELFEQQAERAPDAIAVACEESQLTYRELNQRANQVAHYLRKRGVGPEMSVGICMDRSLDLVIGLLGIMKSGGAYLPLDPDYPKDRLEFMLDDAQSPVLLTQERLRDRLPKYAGKTIYVDSNRNEIVGESQVNPVSQSSGDNLAYIIFTSGSTGQPKGVMIRHAALTNYLNYCLSAYPIQEGRGSLVHSSISFDATITGLYAPLLAGRTVYLLPKTDDLEALANTLRRVRNFSIVKITPAHLAMLSQQIPPEDAAELTRCFVIGGENLVVDQIAFWQKHAPDTLLFNEYGPTETVVGCIVYEASRWQLSGSVPIGRPIANTRVFVLDRHRQPVPLGIVGELYLGGAGVALGYLNRAELSAEKFIADPFSGDPEARLYRTGDLVRYHADGNLEFMGRIDNQVKIRGFRIELGEVEAVLNEHSTVHAVAVLAREDTPGDKRLVAYVVLTPGMPEKPQELRSFLKEKLPDYMIPSAFVFLNSFPLTANGKIDRKALPPPSQAKVALGAAPRNEIEETLVRIWKAVLNLERIGVRDNFFDLGGNSLLAVQVHSQMREELQIQLPIQYLFQFPTIENIAVPIQEEQRQRFSLSATAGNHWKYLREFQAGNGKTPVYMVPGGIAGEVDVEFFFYARLAHYVGHDYPFYGLRPRGADGNEEPHRNVKQMAKDYLQEIRSFQPKGPYYLTGACIGGGVAYEMACLLEAIGEPVAFLGLLDTVCPRFQEYLRYRAKPLMEGYQSAKQTWRENYYVTRTVHHLSELRRMNLAALPRYLGHRGQSVLKDLRLLAKRPKPAAIVEPASEQGTVSAEIQDFQRKYESALRRYRPGQYRGRITIINAQELASQFGASAGWDFFARGEIETDVLPGTHISLFRQDVKILAAQLREFLEKARNEARLGSVSHVS